MNVLSPIAVREALFRPELLALRRRMLGLSQIELASRAGISQGTLSKVELGIKEASDELLLKLAEALLCPKSFFFQAEREYGPPMSAHPMFRKKTTVGSKVLDRVIAEFNVRIAHLRTFLESVDFLPELPLPQYDVDDFGGDPEEVADAVRRAWYVPRGPIRSLTEYVERAGCLVVPCNMESAHIDGVSYRIPGLPPIIFLNKAQPADRLRFSLAHELGHLVMHLCPHPEMEHQADQFAAALLMPRADIGPDVNGLTLERAASLKPVWKVSMAALIVRATTIGRLDPNKAQYLWRVMSARGYRLREPLSCDFPAEQPTLFGALITNLTETMGYTENDLEKALHLQYSELSEMYGLKSKQHALRLVR
ncbi:helix-turn-helix domain-containing protein [Eleftheria terrae]|uniref:helix-turn-helix domain-containing protein n=1 Tax=Eleftheria terrae TaxID=1597781 RepID=UPI00263AF8A4|nr:XRE family transcriptional regulator [Eleftheria terrae]WKB54337.1 XRE family transcriptional regulator [Eleftheria terrae]